MPQCACLLLCAAFPRAQARVRVYSPRMLCIQHCLIMESCTYILLHVASPSMQKREQYHLGRVSCCSVLPGRSAAHQHLVRSACNTQPTAAICEVLQLTGILPTEFKHFMYRRNRLTQCMQSARAAGVLIISVLFTANTTSRRLCSVGALTSLLHCIDWCLVYVWLHLSCVCWGR